MGFERLVDISLLLGTIGVILVGILLWIPYYRDVRSVRNSLEESRKNLEILRPELENLKDWSDPDLTEPEEYLFKKLNEASDPEEQERYRTELLRLRFWRHEEGKLLIEKLDEWEKKRARQLEAYERNAKFSLISIGVLLLITLVHLGASWIASIPYPENLKLGFSLVLVALVGVVFSVSYHLRRDAKEVAEEVETGEARIRELYRHYDELFHGGEADG